jgi:ribose 5-phosphate isomerase B
MFDVTALLAGAISRSAQIAAECLVGAGNGTTSHKHGEAASRVVASGDCRFGIILCGTGLAS